MSRLSHEWDRAFKYGYSRFAFIQKAPEPAPLTTYTIQVYGPDPDFIHYGALARAMRETEENLNDLLSPEKYRVRIREWDAKEEK